MFLTTHNSLNNFLFYGLNTDNNGGVALICVITALVTIIVEGSSRYLFTIEASDSLVIRPREQNNEARYQTKPYDSSVKAKIPAAKRYGIQAIKSCIHAFNTTTKLFIMLVVMSYNVWVLLSVTLGSGVGYALFAVLAQRLCSKDRSKERSSTYQTQLKLRDRKASDMGSFVNSNFEME